MTTHITFRCAKPIALLFFFLVQLLSVQAQGDFISTWKTDNSETPNSTSITIPTHPSATYLYDVDWDNDGVYDEFQITGDASHDYGVAGTYTIRIKGEFPRIYFNNEGDKDKILDVSQWGTIIQWSSMAHAFSGCSNLNISATDAPDLSQVTDMTAMLKGCSNFNSPIGHWNVSTVESFYFTLAYCILFNQPLDDWNTSSATNLQRMFIGCTNFNQPLNNWDVSNVTSFGAMFSNCTSFNQSLSNWNVSKGIFLGLMFSGASSFNGDISTWSPDSVKQMKAMFNGALVFNQDITHWDVSKVTNFENLFKSAKAFNQDIGSWDISEVTNMSWAFAGATNFNQDIGFWDVSKVTNMNWLFFQATSFNQDISNWNVGNVQAMSNMFKGPNDFNQDIGDWDVSNVTTMNSMFESNTSFNQNIGNWDVSMVTSMTRMFNLTALSTENYDSLLIGWNSLTLQDSVEFDAGNSIYCASWSARAEIMTTHNWIIDDAGYPTTLPTPFCKNITVQLDNNGHASITPEMLDDGSYGFCTDVNFTASQTTFDCDDIGELLDTLTVIDGLGNIASCIANVVVLDAGVSFVCPENITVAPDSFGCQANVFWEEPRGNCSVNISSSHNSGDVFPIGTTTVTYTSIDELQNVNTCSFEITVNNTLQISIDSLQNPLCHDSDDGQVFVSISGGLGPYVYDWDHDGVGDADDIEDQANLAEGSYQLSLNDELGCSATSELIELVQPEPLNLSSNISESSNTSNALIDLTVNGGTASYLYDWNTDNIGDFDDPEDINVDQSGLYSVIVKDNNGCTESHDVHVVISAVTTLYELNGFEIFPNPNKGVFIVELENCDSEAEIDVFDAKGVNVFQTSTTTCQTPIALKNLPKGTYFLRLSSRHGTFIKSFINSGENK